MASRGKIITSYKHIPGGARPTPAPQGTNFGSISPLSAELDAGAGGGSWANTYGGFLPRPMPTYTQGAFGPFSPILPVPVDAPPDADTPRAEPRREEYQVGWNLPVGQPGTEGIKMADFNTLRTLADLYSVARSCIQLRKSEIRGLEWDIVPTSDAAKAMRGDHSQMKDFGERRAKAIKFFRHPDPDYYSWNTWIDAVLEEIFVFDALSILLRPKWAKGKGKGLLGSDLDSLALINGPTIRPLYDIHGSYPRPPAPAYQQYLYGVPRTDLMTMITERDIEMGNLSGAELSQFRGDQLLYMPMVPRRWTPYGFPPIERALIPVMSGLQKQGWQLDYFREGTVPSVYISPGGVNSNMTPNQIRELQDALNAVAGDPAWHHKIIVLPADSKVMPQREAHLADQFDEIVMNQVCMAFDVQPMELGIMPKVSTSVSPGASSQMAKATQSIHERKATKPTLMFLADIMNGILRNIADQDDMKFVFEGLQEEEDEETKTNLVVTQIKSGLRSIDEGREALNLQPWGLPETGDPGWATEQGWAPLTEALEAMRTGWAAGPMFELKPDQQGLQPYESRVGESPESPRSAHQVAAAQSALGQKPDAAQAATGPSPDAAAPGGTPEAVATATANEGKKPKKNGKKDKKPKKDDDTQPPSSGSNGSNGSTPGHSAATSANAESRKSEGSAHPYEVRRKAHTDFHSRMVAGRLNSLVAQYQKGAITEPEALDRGVALMARAYQNVMKVAKRHAKVAMRANKSVMDQYAYDPGEVEGGWDNYSPQNDDFYAESKHLAELQRPYLMGLLKDLANKASAGAMNLMLRIGLYAKSTNAVYNTAYGNEFRDSPNAYSIVWHLGTAEHCQPCVDRDGEEFTFDSLPGYPGTGDFGSELCAGGPNCNCWLEYLQQGGPADTIGVTEIKTADPRAVRSELEALARHLKKGREISTWEPRHITNHALARIAEDIAKGMSVDLAVEAAKSRRVVDLNGQVMIYRVDEDGANRPFPGRDQNAAGSAAGPKPVHNAHDTQTELNMSAGRAPYNPEVPGGTPGISAGGEPPRWAPPEGTSSGDTMSGTTSSRSISGGQDGSMPYRSLSGASTPQFGGAPNAPAADEWPQGGHGTGQPQGDGFHVKSDTASAVYDQMSENFPPEAIEWIKNIRWMGPTEIPPGQFDTSNYDTWATSHQPDKVAKFQKKIRDGENVNPVVVVKGPDHDHVKIIDGHHRFTAYRGLGQPVPAYIGYVPEQDGPWMETHSYQIHQGDHPANKDAVRLAAAGVAVRAKDTGRVLMIQRALGDDEDDAGGKWELPGGRLEEGETPFDAAAREWCEETGLEFPDGEVVGTWLSPNGVYRGYAWLTDHEQDVDHLGEREPDPDGDHMEALAWWDLEQLKNNPAVRQELAETLDLLLGAFSQADE